MTSIAIVVIVTLPLLASTVALEAACSFFCRMKERQFARKSRSDAAQKPWRRIMIHSVHPDYKDRVGFPK